MAHQTLDEQRLIDTTGIADRDFADHSGAIQQGYVLGSLTRGLVAYYPMEEGQGQVLHDGALDNLGQINGASWDSGTVGSNALNFNGSSDYVLRDQSQALSTGKNFSISIWFNLDTLSSTTAEDQMFYGARNSSDAAIQLWQNSTDDTIVADAIDGTNTNRSSSTTTPATGNWVHAVHTFNTGTGGKLYINGVQEGSDTTSLSSVDITADVAIGARNANGTIERYVDSSIEEMRVYDRTLSQPEVEVLANLTQPNGSLVAERDIPTLQFDRYGTNLFGAEARYEFEGDVTDSWGENDGTDNTSAGFVDGVYGQAKAFDGSNDIVNLPSGWSFNDGSSGWAISMWLYPETAPTTSAQRQPFGFRDPYFGPYISGGSSDGTWDWRTYDGSTIYEIQHDPPTNEWVHYVFLATDDTNNGHLELYENGQLVGATDSWGVGSDTTGNSLGASPNDSQYFDGNIDDFRIYRNSLSPTQVEQLFNKGAYRIKRGEL